MSQLSDNSETLLKKEVPPIRPDLEFLADIELDLMKSVPYQLGLAMQYIRVQFGILSSDISIIDGVRLRLLVERCIKQSREEIFDGTSDLVRINASAEAALQWLNTYADPRAVEEFLPIDSAETRKQTLEKRRQYYCLLMAKAHDQDPNSDTEH